MWCAGRFFLYTSYYAIFGALFGVANFGRMVAIDNTVNGLFGLLQLPLTNWGLHGLNGNFTALNLIQVRLPPTGILGSNRSVILNAWNPMSGIIRSPWPITIRRHLTCDA